MLLASTSRSDVTRHTSHVTRHSLLFCPASSHMFYLFEVPYRALRSFHSSCVRLQVVPGIFFTFTFVNCKRYQNRKPFWLRPPRSSRTSSIAPCASSILYTCARPAAARADCDGDSVGPCASNDEKEAAAVLRHSAQTRAMHTLRRDMHAKPAGGSTTSSAPAAPSCCAGWTRFQGHRSKFSTCLRLIGRAIQPAWFRRCHYQ